MNDDAPRHVTRIEQHVGTHASEGDPIYDLAWVRTDWADLYPVPYESTPAADRADCRAALADYHAARVALAELPIRRRETAVALIEAESGADPEDCAGIIRRAIAEACA